MAGIRHLLLLSFILFFLIIYCVESIPRRPHCKKLNGLCQIAQDCCDGCCLDGKCSSDDMCAPTCEKANCRSDEVCFLQVVNCFTTPCYPIPTCAPRKTCAILSCVPGKHCVEIPGEHAKCI